MVIAEKFIHSLVDKYRKHTVYTDGGTWYDEACNILKLKHDLNSSIEKNPMEWVDQYFKDRSELFDDYYHVLKMIVIYFMYITDTILCFNI